MKIVFNGMVERKRGGGCNCKKQSWGYTFVNSRMFILPSGLKKTFFVGKVEEVADRDGEFLLMYKTTDANGTKNAFSKVGD